MLLKTSAKAEESKGIKRGKMFGGRGQGVWRRPERNHKQKLARWTMDTPPFLFVGFFFTFSLLFLILSFFFLPNK
jgi:hypothetical protein